MTAASGTVVVTGGNGGIGYRCAEAILSAGRGWHVVIACRPSAKTTEAVAGLRRDYGEAVDALPLDLSSLASVREFVPTLLGRGLPPLKALICNAGMVLPKGIRRTTDGFEMMFGVNHLGHFLLANLLLPHLAPPARIVFVASGTHDPKGSFVARMNPPRLAGAGSLAWPDRDGGTPMSGMRRYATSKLCNILCAYELDRRLSDRRCGDGRRQVTVNVFNPGAVPESGLGREVGWPQRRLLTTRWFLRLLGIRVSTLADAGGGLARLITDPAMEGVTGKYFDGYDEKPSSEESYDLEKARRLWGESARLVGLLPREGVPIDGRVS